jgi:Na+/melibiose symporter-like transporter
MARCLCAGDYQYRFWGYSPWRDDVFRHLLFGQRQLFYVDAWRIFWAAGSALAKRLTRNFSKVQMFGYCAVLAGVLSIALFFAPKSIYVLVPLTFVVSTLYQATTTLMWVMMADVADYGEWLQGKRMDGVIFSPFLPCSNSAWPSAALLSAGR